MLGDLQAGKPLELPWLAGAVVRRSERHGLQADANRFVAVPRWRRTDGDELTRRECHDAPAACADQLRVLPAQHAGGRREAEDRGEPNSPR